MNVVGHRDRALLFEFFQIFAAAYFQSVHEFVIDEKQRNGDPVIEKRRKEICDLRAFAEKFAHFLVLFSFHALFVLVRFDRLGKHFFRAFDRIIQTIAAAVVGVFLPHAAALFFVASGFFARGKIDPSILYKVLLCASAAFVFFSFYLGDVNGALTLHAHNIIEAMAWVVLALGAKKTPVAPHLVFAVGWIAECVGKTLGQLVAPLLAGDPLVLMAVVVMLVLLGVGFAFSEGYNLLDIDNEEGKAEGASANARREALPVAVGEDGAPAAASETAAALPRRSERGAAGAESKDRPADGEGIGEHSCGERPDPYAAFCAEYDLSPRESEVFRLWVTGHGLKYIQNALFVSESTVKSHLRSIYRKCDTHNRDEIIALFEREASEFG